MGKRAVSKVPEGEQAKRFVAYYRVSTARQGRSGLGLEAQRQAVQDRLGIVGGRIVEEVTEVESGKRNDRPELDRALALCRLKGATLIVAKLDRLSRNAAFLMTLRESAVPFVAADMPDANTLTIGILAVVAQAEREAISQRTKAALAAAKKRGVVIGGDRGNLPRVAKRGARASLAVRQEAAAARAADLAKVIAGIRAEGASSLRDIAARLNEREVSAPRGGLWSAAQVSRVIAQAEAA